MIAPPYPLEEIPSPPLGVTYVAAAFQAAGAEVKILDYMFLITLRKIFKNSWNLFGLTRWAPLP